jgi:hypothetical protein
MPNARRRAESPSANGGGEQAKHDAPYGPGHPKAPMHGHVTRPPLAFLNDPTCLRTLLTST